MKIKEAQQVLGLDDDIREYTLEETKELYGDTLLYAKLKTKEPKFYYRDFYITLCIAPDPILKGYDEQGNPIYKPKYIPFARVSCPTPVYRQIVYKYKHLIGDLEYIWTIPSQVRYFDILKNKQKYYDNKETRLLCQFVVLMESGELLNWAKKENGELPDAVIQFTKTEVN